MNKSNMNWEILVSGHKAMPRRVRPSLGVAVLGFFLSTAALAQTYPAQPVKMLLPYAAGGVADITARVLAQRLSQTLGQQLIIDNRPSAGQIVATEAAMKAEPDGYTLLWLNQGHAVSVSLFKSLPYDPVRDFAPISTVGFFGLALLVNSDSPYRSLREFIAAAKASPGRFNVGTTSIGGTQFIAAELFKSMAGLEFQTVPFKATPAIITAVKGKDLDGMVEILAPVIPHIKSGNLGASRDFRSPLRRIARGANPRRGGRSRLRGVRVERRRRSGQ